MEMNEMYLIKLEDYVQHIDEKLLQYLMLKELTEAVMELPDCCPAIRRVKGMARAFSNEAKEERENWCIPESYLDSEDVSELEELMENELIAPEDAGYYTEDDFDYEYDESDDAEDDEIALFCSLVDAAEKTTYAAGQLLKMCNALREQIDEKQFSE